MILFITGMLVSGIPPGADASVTELAGWMGERRSEIANVAELASVSSRAGANTTGYASGVAPVLWILWVAGASAVLWRGTAGGDTHPTPDQ